jgi:type I restriction enzyme M protein
VEPTHNLKSVFDDLRNYLAGNATGITRDETLAREVINLLFCKIHDELQSEDGRAPCFFALANEPPEEVKQRISRLFEAEVKSAYRGVFSPTEHLSLDARSLAHVVSVLQSFHLTTTERDVIGDAFEVFIGPTLRGGEGQFFTPKNVVRLLVESLDPQPGETIIDPACGSGGFLVAAFDHLCQKGVSRPDAVQHVFGIDKDMLLALIAKTYLTLLGQAAATVFCENSLENPSHWSDPCRERIPLGAFNVVLTNPPFGAKIPVQGKSLLSQYALAHRWRHGKGDRWEMTNALLPKQPPQVLFIERCLQLVKEGGRMGIVLPEGIFGNPSERYIWEFIFQNAEVLGVISMPPETFQPSTHTKTSVLILRKRQGGGKRYHIFMGIAEKAGHDKNGKVIYKIRSDGAFVLDANRNKIVDDDTPTIAAKFRAFQGDEPFEQDHLGFLLDAQNLADHILIPEYYNPEIPKYLKELEASGQYTLITIGELVERKVLSIKRGNEIGSQFYGTGDVPFVRTTDIVNWEIKMDPVKAVSEEVYQQYKRRQDVRAGDILFVNDGTFLIGRSAMVTDLDERIVIQSHLRKIRVLKEDLFDRYYFFYLLNTQIVRRQIEAKTFVQATISTLGSRLNEVVLPIHREPKQRQVISSQVRDIIEAKMRLRKRSLEIVEASV